MNYKVEIEERRIGFVEIERQHNESMPHMRERAKEAVEDGLLLPIWEVDEVEIAADPGLGLRCYDATAPCRQKAGYMTAYCGTHDEPFTDDSGSCQRRLDDLAQQADANQERLW